MSKSVLITGASQRIGRSIALSFAKTGWNIALHFNTSRDAAEKTKAELEALGACVALFKADLSEPAAVLELIPKASAEIGPLLCLVNNAARFEMDNIFDFTASSFDAHLKSNLMAPALLSQSFFNQLPDSLQGNIVNIIDQRVFNLRPEFLSYTLSKAGLWTLTQTMAMSMAPKIRVNAIGPGPTLANTRQSTAQFKQQQASVPLGYGPLPEEIARAVHFILESPSMTGEFIALDGGQHLPTAKIAMEGEHNG
ncbi:SDR family oxidoreductase [Sneathiella marina]|uniref:SDR family oxidoreductase n=1 Tax=Sneathiella marina TaxID=2950108 RepID=A0ABY4W5B5_9PROT|nr:SDR family oxidoreductase [Sneathiella marina]USG62383.1 SDR family oxidoreductase [Sneathiella marina]